MAIQTKKSISEEVNLDNHLGLDYSKLLAVDNLTVKDIPEFISTGNLMLNCAMTGNILGGIPAERATCLAGQSGSGKTYLCLNIAREAIKQGYVVVYFDSENAIDSSVLKSFNIDSNYFKYLGVGTIQEFRNIMTSLCDNLIEQRSKLKGKGDIPKTLVILDSAGNLASTKEIEDAKTNSDKADFTRQKLMKSLFRIIMSKLPQARTTFVFTQHTYATMDFISTERVSGGTGLIYAASNVLNLSKAKLKATGDTSAVYSGIIVTAKQEKNRFCKPYPVKFQINFNSGMNPYIGLQEYLSFENCGVGYGNLVTEGEYNKMSSSDKGKCHKVQGGYYKPSESARSLVNENGEVIPIKKLFTKEVFTDEVLERLDAVISKDLKYSKTSYGEETDMNNIIDNMDEEDVFSGTSGSNASIIDALSKKLAVEEQE